MARFRACPADAVRATQIDGLTFLYHRASGQTHVLAPPAPEMLELLVAPQSPETLLQALGERFDLPDGGARALVARLDELVAAGLVERL